MGKVKVTLEGNGEDKQRIYEHLIYHVKKISSVDLQEFLKKDNPVKFTVTI